MKRTNKDLCVKIIGQSNALGSGNKAPSQMYLRNLSKRVKVYDGLEWKPLIYGINNNGNVNPTGDHGIELEIGYQLSLITTGNIYILKHAIGNTSLYVDWSSGGGVYNDHLNYALNGLQSIPNVSNVIYLGDYFNQGEADAEVQLEAEAYAPNIDDLKIRLKNDFSEYITDKYTFVKTRIRVLPSLLYYQTVRDAQELSPFIDQDDLEGNPSPDGIHLNSESQNILANRALNIFLKKI